MGQAKRRGTFSQRMVEAKARRISEELLRREEEAAREAAMTPAEKEARRRARRFLTMTTGLIVGMSSNAEVKGCGDEK